MLGVSGRYNLLFDCALPSAEDGGAKPFTDLIWDECVRNSTIEGYACTPLVKAYDLFNEKMRDESLARREAWCEGGAVVAMFSERMKRKHGYAAADLAKQHLDEARRGTPLLFVYDFALASTPFTGLQFLFDAQQAPLVDQGESFATKYTTFPRKLVFQEARARSMTHIDWFSHIYT